MVKAISIDLRQRILRMMLDGSSCRAAARHFGVGESTAIRLKRRYAEFGTITPKRGGRAGSGKLDRMRDYVLALVKSKPDLTLKEISAQILEQTGVKISYVRVWLFLSREKVSYKKNLDCQ